MTAPTDLDRRLAARQRSLSRLYGGLAHDLKSPFNSLGLNLQVLELSIANERDLGEESRERLTRCARVFKRELEQLHRLTELVMTQLRPPEEERVRSSLQEIVTEVVQLLGPRAKQRKVTLEVETPPATILVDGFRDQLVQALLETSLHVLEAIPEERGLRLIVVAEPEHALVTVGDVGDPSAEILDMISEPHLDVARSIVADHGGTIEARSTDGTAELRIHLPRLVVETTTREP